MKFLKFKIYLKEYKLIFYACLVTLIFSQVQAQSINLADFTGRCVFNEECEEIEYSDLAYHPVINMLFMPIDSPRDYPLGNACNEADRTGIYYSMRAFDLNEQIEYEVELSPYHSPRDFEGLTYLEGNFFALAEENTRVVHFLELSYTFDNNTNLYSDIMLTSVGNPVNLSSQIGISTSNNADGTDGVEGITYNPTTDRIYLVTERDPIMLYAGVVTFTNSIPNGINLDNNSIDLGGLFPAGAPHYTKDVSAIYHLGQNYPVGHSLAERMLVLSDASGNGRIFEINADGTLVNNALAISEVPITEFQPEGINFINGSIYIASEGDKDNNSVRAKLIEYSSPSCNLDCTAGDVEQWNVSTCQCEVILTVVNGCTDPSFCNYDSAANCDDGSCQDVVGCTDQNACNYNPGATCDDGSCLVVLGCTDPTACNFDPNAECDDSSCQGVVGCMDVSACNYNPNATCDDGSCELVTGCIACDEGSWYALKALYINTDGDNWVNNTGWELVTNNNSPPANCDLNSMFGVTAFISTQQSPPIIFVDRLELPANNLIGDLPAEIADITSMHTINLSDNQISGSLPNGWFNGNNTDELKYVDLSNNNIGGTLPDEPDMGEIASINLSYNQLTGPIPDVYFEYLNGLYLNDNQLTGNINGLTYVALNKDFDISENQLSGCYAQILKQKCDQQNTNSQVISDGNNFDAAWDDFCLNDAGACVVSCNLDDWTALQALYASTDGDNWSNNLNWQIVHPSLTAPPPNCDLRSMYGVDILTDGRVAILDLFNNNLSGTIPPEIGLLTNISEIDLANNMLTGSLPAELGQLGSINLSTLSVINNQLSGCFDPALSSLCSLYSAGIDYGNNFDGTWSGFCSAGNSPACVELEIFLFLEGAYDEDAPNQQFQPRHTNHLYNRNLLPGMTAPGANSPIVTAGQPYNRPPWNYWGTEGSNFTNADYTSNDVDWVLVSIRSGVNKSDEVAKLAGVLQVDGSIRFFSSVYLNSTNEYYVVVEHRNHLPIMSQVPVGISNNKLTFDFRIEDSYTADGTGVGQTQSSFWKSAYAGNSVQGNGGMTDTNDINGSDKIPWSQNNGKFYQYSPEDFNLDGDINGTDKIFWSRNNGFSSRVPQ